MNPSQVPQLRLLDLDVLDARELQRVLPKGSYRVEEEKLGPGQHGDLGLEAAIVLLLAQPVLLALSKWLLKKNRTYEFTFEALWPDGRVERISKKFDISDIETSESEIMKELIAAMKLEPSMIANLLTTDVESRKA